MENVIISTHDKYELARKLTLYRVIVLMLISIPLGLMVMIGMISGMMWILAGMPFWFWIIAIAEESIVNIVAATFFLFAPINMFFYSKLEDKFPWLDYDRILKIMLGEAMFGLFIFAILTRIGIV